MHPYEETRARVDGANATRILDLTHAYFADDFDVPADVLVPLEAAELAAEEGIELLADADLAALTVHAEEEEEEEEEPYEDEVSRAWGELAEWGADDEL